MYFKDRITGKINTNNEVSLIRSWHHSIGNRQNRPLDGRVKIYKKLYPREDVKTHGSVKILQYKNSASTF